MLLHNLLATISHAPLHDRRFVREECIASQIATVLLLVIRQTVGPVSQT